MKLWIMKYKLNCLKRILGTTYVTKSAQLNKHQNIIEVVKHSGGSIMISACFPASGPGSLAIMEEKINSQVNEIFYRITSWLVSAKWSLCKSWVMQDNDPKHGGKATTIRLQTWSLPARILTPSRWRGVISKDLFLQMCQSWSSSAKRSD